MKFYIILKITDVFVFLLNLIYLSFKYYDGPFEMGIVIPYFYRKIYGCSLFSYDILCILTIFPLKFSGRQFFFLLYIMVIHSFYWDILWMSIILL